MSTSTFDTHSLVLVFTIYFSKRYDYLIFQCLLGSKHHSFEFEFFEFWTKVAVLIPYLQLLIF